MKNVIHIFGASGSGTSTLGRKICSELGYRFLDTEATNRSEIYTQTSG